MDSIFNLEETERSSLLQQMIDSFGCTYVCLWSHFSHPSNCLIFIDGVYRDGGNNQASSSSGSLGMRSFLDYQKSTFLIDNYSVGVPGFAFKNNLPYMESKGLELLRLTTNAPQLQFYQAARIKTAIFMGCKNGEIELGMSNGTSQTNFEIELKKLFPGDFPQEMLPKPLDQARASSSSSSLRSLSIENSSEYSPFLFNMLQTTSYNTPEMIFAPKEAFLDQQTPNQTPSPLTIRSQNPLQQVLDQIRSNHLMPLRENEEAAMTRAILAAISSSPSPSSSSSHQLQTPQVANNSAFKRYRSCLGPTKQRMQISRQNLNRRSLSFFRNLSEARAQQDRMFQTTTRPTSNQLHHMISERKRREKLNESFQALRSLLPSGSKKDKASVLTNTKEYIASLKSQIEELNKRNKILEGENSGRLEAVNRDSGGFSGERVTVGIRNVGESSSESRMVELEVHARGDLILADLVIRMMEFIKQVEHATVVSVDAGTQTLENEVSANRVVLRLRIQGSEWDESSFLEAVRRVLDNLAQ
ncbi:hypothetical protein L6452_26433 [Arctium lappa]|uniref:Uncharacterized protein n=1 Tax=Arctium lappa TaxID=4217 RepID=A0ACB8ZV07_ARCLA|nr:hypothetical protein L6452_26433 [Arctium lappa]